MSGGRGREEKGGRGVEIIVKSVVYVLSIFVSSRSNLFTVISLHAHAHSSPSLSLSPSPALRNGETRYDRCKIWLQYYGTKGEDKTREAEMGRGSLGGVV